MNLHHLVSQSVTDTYILKAQCGKTRKVIATKPFVDIKGRGLVLVCCVYFYAINKNGIFVGRKLF